jgi:hypothetical protein
MDRVALPPVPHLHCAVVPSCSSHSSSVPQSTVSTACLQYLHIFKMFILLYMTNQPKAISSRDNMITILIWPAIRWF